ncbi:unnamed protein product [Phytomonas sp. EM1]|nr:unnamed protein product [Phytomonas sp. EM1]|eukprot:CCW60173.1 unnamed protein product [Phytomonas sp. isolate EM1]
MNGDSKDSVKRAITEAAVENFELLLESRESNKRIDAVASEAIRKSNLLRETLAKLQFHSQRMSDVGASWRGEKQILTNAMSNYPQLLAIAEAPSLLRDCIYHGMYHQALLLIEHMSRITPRDARAENPFTRIQLELWHNLDVCFDEVVLPRLSEALTVDVTFKLITFLRRLGIDKSRVSDLFLERRTIYLDRLMQEAEQSPLPYTRVIKLIKIYQNQTSEVLTQYGVCFLPSPERQAEEGERREAEDEEDADDAEGWGEGIQRWCYTRAERFLAAFERAVELLTNGSELALVAEQCAACTASVVGLRLDVSPALHAILRRRVRGLFAAQMTLAAGAYTRSMRGVSWRRSTTLRGSGRAVEGAISETAMGTSPPVILARCLPLACAVNGMLTAFNLCRRVVLAGVPSQAAEHLVGLLRRIAADLTREAAVVETLPALEQGGYDDFVRVFVGVLFPYVMECTERLFGVDARRWVEGGMAKEIEELTRRLPAEGGKGEAGEPVQTLAAAPSLSVS